MIHPETADFELSLDRIVEQMKGRLKIFVVEFIQDLNEAVVERTPVVTGFLRGSWFASIGSPPEASGGSADLSGGSAVARMNLVATQIKIGDVYYAANGAAYAAAVEYGAQAHDIFPKSKMTLHWEDSSRMPHWSKHVWHPGNTPRAFVRATMADAPAIAARTAARIFGT